MVLSLELTALLLELTKEPGVVMWGVALRSNSLGLFRRKGGWDNPGRMRLLMSPLRFLSLSESPPAPTPPASRTCRADSLSPLAAGETTGRFDRSIAGDRRRNSGCLLVRNNRPYSLSRLSGTQFR